MSGETYTFSDDSRLLRSALEGARGGSFLEIGTGNAGVLAGAAPGFVTAVGTDLARPEMDDWRATANVMLCDGASCFRDSSFDLVAFNPPYLRGRGDRAVEGGEGLEVPLWFLKEALRVVKRDGRVVFVLDQDAEIGEFSDECSRSGFDLRKAASEHLFFEELTVYEAVPRPGRETVRTGRAGK